MKNKYLLLAIIFVMVVACLSGCTDTNNTSDNENKNEMVYNWSEMTDGPYRDKVSFATSTDLLNWTDSGVILAEHASVPGAVYKDGVIYVYFVDVSEDGKPEQIGIILSDDNGLTWSNKEYVVFDGIGEMVPVDPAPFVRDDGSIRLYYYDINEGRTTQSETNKIYSAFTIDGINFKQDEGVRFSYEKVFDPDVIEVDGAWRMYVGDVEANRVISAVSSDGLDFEYEGVAYSGGAVPDVFFKDATYYLYTAGIDISTSLDGASFSKTEFSFRPSDLTADPSVIELNDGTYMMLYKTR